MAGISADPEPTATGRPDIAFVPSNNSDSTHGAWLIVKNSSPDVLGAYADPGELWPPNNKMFNVSVLGVVDPDGDAVSITITDVSDDETSAATDHGPLGSSTIKLRAKRNGNGQGRTYTVVFGATDAWGASSEGTVSVFVPHDKRNGEAEGRGKPAISVYPNPANPATTVGYTLPEDTHVTITVYNTLGQQVGLLVNEQKGAGSYSVKWNGTDAMGRSVTSGLYLIRFTFGE